MKHFLKLFLVIFFAVILLTGCATTQEVKTSIVSKASSWTSNVDPAVVNQLPADKKELFPKAEYDLNLANQKVKLAKLKTDLASAQKKYADIEEDIAENMQKEADIDYDLVKIEAIMKAGLGKAEDNPKVKANLQSKKLQAQGDRLKLNANLEAQKGKINSLTSEVNKMEEAVKNMKFEGSRAASTVPKPKE